MDMTDLGEKMQETSPVQAEGTKQKISYPSFSLSNKIPDELFSREIGDTCKLTIIAKITNKGIDETTERKRKNMFLEVHKLGLGGASKEEYLNMPDDVKDEYDEADMKDKE